MHTGTYNRHTYLNFPFLNADTSRMSRAICILHPIKVGFTNELRLRIETMTMDNFRAESSMRFEAGLSTRLQEGLCRSVRTLRVWSVCMCECVRVCVFVGDRGLKKQSSIMETAQAFQ